MLLDRFPEIRALSFDQQMRLSEELFIAACGGGPPLTAEEIAVLDERLREYEENPDRVLPHSEVMKHFDERRRQRERMSNA